MRKFSQSHVDPAENAVAVCAPQQPASAFSMQALLTWLRLALYPGTVRRAVLTAAIVGTVLIAINHGSAILRGDIGFARIVQMILTLAVPYIVSTVSSVSTRLEFKN